MRSLWLVRHGRPRVDPARPAAAWPLDGRSDADLVVLRAAGGLPRGARWVSSPEPKAHTTATVLRQGPVEVCDGLVEQQRGVSWFDDATDFTTAVRRALDQPDEPAVPGWEPAAATRRRVAEAVRRLVEQTAIDLVLVGHGTAWTLLVAELTGTEPDLAAWAAMRMPDVCRLDLGTEGIAVVHTPWGQTWGQLDSTSAASSSPLR